MSGKQKRTAYQRHWKVHCLFIQSFNLQMPLNSCKNEYNFGWHCHACILLKVSCKVEEWDNMWATHLTVKLIQSLLWSMKKLPSKKWIREFLQMPFNNSSQDCLKMWLNCVTAPCTSSKIARAESATLEPGDCLFLSYSCWMLSVITTKVVKKNKQHNKTESNCYQNTMRLSQQF